MMKKALLLLIALTVTGCGTQNYSATVTRFHRDLPPAGETFAIQPQNDQKGSVEFDTYAGTVVSQMVSAGYRPATPGKPADLLVEFRYGIDNGRSELVSTPLFARDAFWHRQNCARVAPPFDCGVPPLASSDIQSYTVFTRWVELSVVDSRKKSAQPVKLFEGRAYSEGSNRNLPEVVPPLVAALFTEFPGLNGETRTVVVAPDCCGAPKRK
ncbi:DUF4136 domain-containing protein [Azospirillum sp. sgz301742]